MLHGALVDVLIEQATKGGAYRAATILTVLLTGILLAYLEIRFTRYLAERTARSRFRWDGVLVGTTARPLGVLIIALSVTLALRLVPDLSLGALTVDALETALFILLGTWFLAVVIREIVHVYGKPYVENTDTDFDNRLLDLLDLTATVFIGIIGLLLALNALGIAITPFLASMGIVGLALALAARTTLGNFFAGIVLTLDRTIQPGHRLQIDDTIGEVVDIGRYKTILRTRDNLLVGVPNDTLMSSQLTNFDLPNALRRIELTLGVAYGTDLEEASSIIEDITQSVPKVIDDPAPEVNVTRLDDSSIHLQTLVWQKDPRGARRTRDRIYRETLQRFHEAGIEIPYPQLDVSIEDQKSAPPTKAMLGDDGIPP